MVEIWDYAKDKAKMEKSIFQYSDKYINPTITEYVSNCSLFLTDPAYNVCIGNHPKSPLKPGPPKIGEYSKKNFGRHARTGAYTHAISRFSGMYNETFYIGLDHLELFYRASEWNILTTLGERYSGEKIFTDRPYKWKTGYSIIGKKTLFMRLDENFELNGVKIYCPLLWENAGKISYISDNFKSVHKKSWLDYPLDRMSLLLRSLTPKGRRTTNYLNGSQGKQFYQEQEQRDSESRKQREEDQKRDAAKKAAETRKRNAAKRSEAKRLEKLELERIEKEQEAMIDSRRFVKVRKLRAEGGMAEIYMGKDKRTGEQVIWKQAAPSRKLSAKEANRALSNEAEVLERLDHPRIPEFIESGYVVNEEGDRVLVLIMENIEGGSLDDEMKTFARRGKKQDFDYVIETLVQCCEALEYMADLEPPLYHRDIKPHNIMTHLERGVVLIDFGLAKEVSAGSGMSLSAGAHTAGWSPPERERAQTGPYTDVYSLGQVLWHMLTNEHAGIYSKDQHVKAITEAGHPEWLAELVNRATIPVPVEDRIQTVAEFRIRLENEGELP